MNWQHVFSMKLQILMKLQNVTPLSGHLLLDYNFEEAFEKVSNEWKTELMITVADKALKWFDNDIPEKAVVTVVNGRIQVDCKQCSLCSKFCRDVMAESP